MLSCNGHSAIRSKYPTIVSTSVTRAVQTYSVGKQGEMVEITTGIHLLGAPVGSHTFVEAFLLEAMDRTRTDSVKLHAKITDLQTRLRLFKQCVIEQLPHFLGNEVLHTTPLDYDALHWEEWQGPLTTHIDDLISSFYCNLLHLDNTPAHALQITQISVTEGGLGFVDPSSQAIPDFVITMAHASQIASNGLQLERNAEPLTLPNPSPTSTFLPKTPTQQSSPDSTTSCLPSPWW